MTLQHKFRVVHLWLGLVAGLFIVMMGLSGFVIVFRTTIEAAASPKVRSGVVNLALVEQGLASAHPGAKVSRVTFPESATLPVLVQSETTDKQRLLEFFDGSTGQALGPKKTMAWLDWIADLHQNLLMGKSGRSLTGIIGVALLLLSCSGLLSWMSGRRDWKSALAIPRKGPWPRVNYQGHKWVGFWSNLFLIAVSFTGVVLAYPDTFEQALRAVWGQPETAKAAPTTGRAKDKLLAPDEYIRAAAASVQGGVVRELRLPNRGHAAVSVVMWAPGDVRPKGTTVVQLDPASAQVLSVERSSRGLIDLANAIHKTELGGLPVKLAWSLLGFMPLVLFLSGAQIWWHQRAAASRAKRKAAAEELVGSAPTSI